MPVTITDDKVCILCSVCRRHIMFDFDKRDYPASVMVAENNAETAGWRQDRYLFTCPECQI